MVKKQQQQQQKNPQIGSSWIMIQCTDNAITVAGLLWPYVDHFSLLCSPIPDAVWRITLDNVILSNGVVDIFSILDYPVWLQS